MKFASVKDFSQSPSKFFQLKDTVILTKNGKPIRAIVSMSEEELEDFILAQHLNLEQDAKKALKFSAQNKNISSEKLRAKFIKKAEL
ncbi:MAG: hypothetical protein HQM15_06650 [Deltaproteobacteria bacterium]|nr:hypothetical protein [Deltaproteobacteria bacterium]